MSQGSSDSNLKTRLDAALALAQAGNFVDLATILDALASEDSEVRIKAAYSCERIGCSAAIEPLSRMATNDRVSDNRNQAIIALGTIGRAAVVPTLITALNDEDVERREDARAALYRVVGRNILQKFAEENGGEVRDLTESRRVAEWWRAQSVRFDPALVYSMGELASPAVFIRELKATHTTHPDAYLDALRDWTGNDFGESPLPKVITQWENWWATNKANYEAGRRYFYGHQVP